MHRNSPIQTLTETAIHSMEPARRPRQLSDGGGLYVLVVPRSGRYWRYNYRFKGWQKTLALGPIQTFRLRRRGRVTVGRDACLPLALIHRYRDWNCGGARDVDRRAILTSSGQCWTPVGRLEAPFAASRKPS